MAAKRKPKKEERPRFEEEGAEALLHRLWSEMTKAPGYDKRDWKVLHEMLKSPGSHGRYGRSKGLQLIEKLRAAFPDNVKYAEILWQLFELKFMQEV